MGIYNSKILKIGKLGFMVSFQILYHIYPKSDIIENTRHGVSLGTKIGWVF